MRKNLNLRANIALGLIFAFLLNSFGPLSLAQAQEFHLPAPGQMVALSPAFSPAVLKGIKLDPQNPFRFHFYVDTGDDLSLRSANGDTLRSANGDIKPRRGFVSPLQADATRLIKYFLASLTIPEKDLWVNLSPYEKDRIVPKEFSLTEMGRDLLAEDYLLKQITASLIYPESRLGKEFWQKVYAKAQAKYGTTNIPIDTFNKVWIVPDKAVVYENNGTAFVLENHLKVMLEQDYLAFENNQSSTHQRLPGDMFKSELLRTCPHAGCQTNERLNVKAPQGNNVSTSESVNAFGSQIVREIVIPALTKEVNEGKNFAQLRQVFYSLILATWYKKKIKDSILNKIYSNRNKIQGLVIPTSSTVIPAKAGIQNKDNVEFIYQQYLQAFKKGVYNYIKEESFPPLDGEGKGGVVIPRKYFSGGVNAQLIDVYLAMVGPKQVDPAQLADLARIPHMVDVKGDFAIIHQSSNSPADGAMIGKDWVLDDVNPRYFKKAGSEDIAKVTRENIVRRIDQVDTTTPPNEIEGLINWIWENVDNYTKIQFGKSSPNSYLDVPNFIETIRHLSRVWKGEGTDDVSLAYLLAQGSLDTLDEGVLIGRSNFLAQFAQEKEITDAWKASEYVVDSVYSHIWEFHQGDILGEYNSLTGQAFTDADVMLPHLLLLIKRYYEHQYVNQDQLVSVIAKGLDLDNYPPGDHYSNLLKRKINELINHYSGKVLDLKMFISHRRGMHSNTNGLREQSPSFDAIEMQYGKYWNYSESYRMYWAAKFYEYYYQNKGRPYFNERFHYFLNKIFNTNPSLDILRGLSWFLSHQEFIGIDVLGEIYGDNWRAGEKIRNKKIQLSRDRLYWLNMMVKAVLFIERNNKDLPFYKRAQYADLAQSVTEKGLRTSLAKLPVDGAMKAEQKLIFSENVQGAIPENLGEKSEKLIQLKQDVFNVPKFFVIKSNGSGGLILDDQLREAFSNMRKPVIVRSTHPQEGGKFSYSGIFDSFSDITVLTELEAIKTRKQRVHDFDDVITESVEGAYEEMIALATDGYKINDYKKSQGITDFNPKLMNAIVMEQIAIDVFGMFVTSDQQYPEKISIFFEVRGEENKGLGGVISYDKNTHELESNNLSKRLQNILIQFGETAVKIEKRFGVQQVELASSREDGKVYVFQSRNINLGNPKDVPRFARYKTLDESLQAVGYGSYRAPVLVIDALDKVSDYKRSEKYRSINAALSEALKNKEEVKAKGLGKVLKRLNQLAKEKYRQELLEFQQTHSDYILVIKDADAVIDWKYKSIFVEKSYDFLNKLASKAKVVIRGKQQSAIRHEDWSHVDSGGVTIWGPESGQFLNIFKYRRIDNERRFFRNEDTSTSNKKIVQQYSLGIATGDYLNVLSNTDGVFVWQDLAMNSITAGSKTADGAMTIELKNGKIVSNQIYKKVWALLQKYESYRPQEIKDIKTVLFGILNKERHDLGKSKQWNAYQLGIPFIGEDIVNRILSDLKSSGLATIEGEPTLAGIKGVIPLANNEVVVTIGAAFDVSDTSYAFNKEQPNFILQDPKKDGAMKIPGPGGIDFNPAQLSMKVKKEGDDFKFNFNGIEIDAAQVTGATFTIRTMTPVTNLPQILGLNLEPADKRRQT